jgi:taurine dioxygenase
MENDTMALIESLGGYNHISVRRNASALGAEIEGVQISDVLKDDQIFDEIIQAFQNHQVTFFRDQKLTPENHMAFGERFGELEEHPFVSPLAGYPKIMRVVKEPEDDLNFGNRPPGCLHPPRYRPQSALCQQRLYRTL